MFPAGLRVLHRGILCVTLALLTTAAVAAFPRPEVPLSAPVYFCREATTPPIIDGRLDDVCWQKAAWTDPFLDIQGPQQAAPRFTTRAKMTWDDRYFYVAAQLEEPHIWATYTDRDTVIYHENDFEVFIDPDGDNHQYMELEINALGTEWDLLLVKPYRDGAPAINAWDIQGLLSAVHLDGTLNDATDTDGGWSVELAFPWAVLGQCAGRRAPPHTGDTWRVNFSRVQWHLQVEDGRYSKQTDPVTGASLPEDNWVWSPQGLIAMHYPEMWGKVVFVEQTDFLRSESDLLTETVDIDRAHELMEIYYLQRQWLELHGDYAASLNELGIDAGATADRGELVLETCSTGFRAHFQTADMTVSVDEQGRLSRRPLRSPYAAPDQSPAAPRTQAGATKP